MKQNGCKFKCVVAGASLAMLLALQGMPTVALASESVNLDGGDAIEIVEEGAQQDVEPLDEDLGVQVQSDATNTVFSRAQEISLGSTVEREFSLNKLLQFENYYYKFKTTGRRARYQVTIDSLNGKRIHFEVRDQNNDKWQGSGGSSGRNFCYTTSRGYCYKDDADFEAWYYIKVTHNKAKRYDKFALTVTELPDISSSEITGIKNKSYTGEAVVLDPVVTFEGNVLREGYDYAVSYKNNKFVGTATIKIEGVGEYSGTIVRTFQIVEAKNPLVAKRKKASVTVSYSKVKTQKVTLGSSYIKVSKAKGTVTYTNASTDATAKKFSVNGKTGKVTIPARTKKGTYTIKVKVTASGTYGYKKGSKTVSYKIVIK